MCLKWQWAEYIVRSTHGYIETKRYSSGGRAYAAVPIQEVAAVLSPLKVDRQSCEGYGNSLDAAGTGTTVYENYSTQ